MDNLTSYILIIAEHLPVKVVISNPVKKQKEIYKKIVITKKREYYQAECFTQKQVFHENIKPKELNEYISNIMDGKYTQLNAWCEIEGEQNGMEFSVKISNKGKVLFSKLKNNIDKKVTLEHNRTKNYILPEGKVIEPLIDMGIFTKDGVIVRSMNDKYKQINRFVETIDDAIKNSGLTKMHIIDFGCGKSYLTFILYYYFTEIMKIDVTMVGLDLKKEVIQKCNESAQRYGYDKLRFELGDINGYVSDTPVDMVISLHACDTATDYALFNAIQWKASMIFAVPCCQHECNAQMKSDAYSILTRYGLVKERTAALMTDAIRSNLLIYCGYKTQMLEFIDSSHTPKNILIRAYKSNISEEMKDKAFKEVTQMVEEFHLSPTLLGLIQGRVRTEIKE